MKAQHGAAEHRLEAGGAGGVAYREVGQRGSEVIPGAGGRDADGPVTRTSWKLLHRGLQSRIHHGHHSQHGLAGPQIRIRIGVGFQPLQGLFSCGQLLMSA